MPKNAIYVGRPTPFGNPFSHLGKPPTCYTVPHDWKAGSVAEAVERYADFATSREIHDWLHDNFEAYNIYEMSWTQALEYLRGHDLACWCPLDQPCHADVLLDLANQ
jgi:hypothetical protein